ncbi:ATP-dependent RNA helicase DDX42-like [Lytechinus variegatus]|uniref:ATP-dependent RNA helicase DDX42-like n=1 Tax=Lytechinus variegatus TaxID=7654 RepID=UPI001BB1E4B9|nr:ATP-dependent RNA helicase DDX42-like [Lytechinus variegatus]XP_041478435.1 ATP-dependent RNA helicase DDX42-like [Lytechinus variegatus]
MHRGGGSGGMYNRFVPASRGRDKKSLYSNAIMGFDEQDLEKIKKRHRTEQEYFDADSDEETGGPAPKKHDTFGDRYRNLYYEEKAPPKKEESSDEEDPLDAFMAGIKDELSKEEKEMEAKRNKKKATRTDIEELDEMEEYMKYMEENPEAGLNTLPINDEDEPIDYDADGNPIVPERSKIIDPLPPVDHSMIDYEPFNKNFYNEHESIQSLNYSVVMELRKKLGIKVSGADPPKPATSFAHFGFDEQLMHCIRKSDFSSPTPIQAQGVPIAMCGRDIIGIAKTGSGKTAAFVWPMLVHIMDQRAIKKGDGPIGLICAPTRELAQQIYIEVKKFGKAYNIHCVCAYGGGNMHEQQRACDEGPEVIVATPGRLIDLVKKKATNLRRVSYLVFDEADRMFDMGFEPQVRSIANHVRPDRQTLLFSATFRKKVERLARDILTDPIRVIQGDIGEANQDVTQVVEIFSDQTKKFPWLLARLVRFTTEGSVLIFVTKKINAEELATSLKRKDFEVGLLHGDMNQLERNEVITSFKRRAIPILVATDVAARGLDIPSIKNVVNYDVARDIDTHTHRIGRTGRAGEKGTAYTLILKKENQFAGDLVRNLEGADQAVPKSLLDLAMQNPYFKKSRYRAGKGKRLNIGGGGLGYRERPSGGGSSGGGSSMEFLGSSDGDEGDRGVGSLYANRLHAMKSAFSNQFKSHFVASSSSPSTSNLSFRTPTQFEPASNVGGGAPKAPPAQAYKHPTPTPQGGAYISSSQVSSSTGGYHSATAPMVRTYTPGASASYAPSATSPSSSQGNEASGHERGSSVSFGHIRRSNMGRDRSSGGGHGDRRHSSSSDGRDHHREDRSERGREDDDGSEVKVEQEGDVEIPDGSTKEGNDHGWTLRGVNFGVGSETAGLHGSMVSSSSISSSSSAGSSTGGSSAEQTKPKRKSRWDT